VPSDSCASGNVAVREALVKDISLNSMPNALSTGFPASRDSGFGAYLIDTDYESSRGNNAFDLKIVFRETKDRPGAIGRLRAITLQDGWNALRYSTRMSRKMFASLFGEKIERQIGSKPIMMKALLRAGFSRIQGNHCH